MISAAVLITSLLIAINASIGGTFLVLRRMGMLTDAIAHAILPGLVVGYLLAESRSSPLITILAAATGLLVTLLIYWLNKFLNVWVEAGTGMVYTSFFALGILGVTLFGENADLDTDCILYGELLWIPFRRPLSGTFLDYLPWAVWQQLILLGLWVLLLLPSWPLWKSISFDIDFARTQGLNIERKNLQLLSLVSLSTVWSFEAVGAILVMGFMLLPAATAWLWVKRLEHMLALAIGLASLSAAGGYLLAWWINLDPSTTMVLVSGCIFFLSLIWQRKSTLRVG
jgi:manganese/zinc/iron transport system permease protein